MVRQLKALYLDVTEVMTEGPPSEHRPGDPHQGSRLGTLIRAQDQGILIRAQDWGPSSDHRAGDPHETLRARDPHQGSGLGTLIRPQDLGTLIRAGEPPSGLRAGDTHQISGLRTLFQAQSWGTLIRTQGWGSSSELRTGGHLSGLRGRGPSPGLRAPQGGPKNSMAFRKLSVSVSGFPNRPLSQHAGSYLGRFGWRCSEIDQVRRKEGLSRTLASGRQLG